MHNKFKKGNRFTAVGLGLAAAAVFGIGSQQARSANAPSPWPLQLEMRVPFEPTAYPSAGRNYLTYELYLTNFSSNPLTLRRVEVLDADDLAAPPIAAFEAGQLDALMQPIGAQTSAAGDPHQLAGGATVTAPRWVHRQAEEEPVVRLSATTTTPRGAHLGAVQPEGSPLTELRDGCGARFMGRLFGTDGVRGVAGDDPTGQPATALAAAAAGGSVTCAARSEWARRRQDGGRRRARPESLGGVPRSRGGRGLGLRLVWMYCGLV